MEPDQTLSSLILNDYEGGGQGKLPIHLKRESGKVLIAVKNSP
jgi:hypothetical protein